LPRRLRLLAMTGLVVYGWLNSDFGFLP